MKNYVLVYRKPLKKNEQNIDLYLYVIFLKKTNTSNFSLSIGTSFNSVANPDFKTKLNYKSSSGWSSTVQDADTKRITRYCILDS